MANTAATHDERLIGQWIEPNPQRPGVDQVRIEGYGMSVWT